MCDGIGLAPSSCHSTLLCTMCVYDRWFAHTPRSPAEQKKRNIEVAAVEQEKKRTWTKRTHWSWANVKWNKSNCNRFTLSPIYTRKFMDFAIFFLLQCSPDTCVCSCAWVRFMNYKPQLFRIMNSDQIEKLFEWANVINFIENKKTIYAHE